jgi:hypothetical protein
MSAILPSFNPYPNDEVVVLQGGELFLSGGMMGRAMRLSGVYLASMDTEFRSPRISTFCDSHNEPAAYAYGRPEMEITLRLMGYGEVMADSDRKAMLAKLCAGASVNELLGVISGKLKERESA